MKTIQYTGDIWDGDGLHPDLWDLLQQTDLLIETVTRTPSNGQERPIFLGVPHHGPPQLGQIAEDWINPKTGKSGRPCDENTGLVGLALFSALQERGFPCRLVIAAHPTDHDPNKTPGSPYWESLLGGSASSALPGLFFELHAAAERRRHALELSAGSNDHTGPLLYGKVLAHHLRKEDWLLAVQRQPGSPDAAIYKAGQQTGGKLQNPALETTSLTYAGEQGIPALHLEMKSLFRGIDIAPSRSVRPVEAGQRLVQALAESLVLLHRSPPVHITGKDLGLPTTAFLTRPSMAYEESFWAALREADLIDIGNNPDLRIFSREHLPGIIEFDARVFYGGLPDDPPEEILWLIDRDEFIGRVFFFHWLNDYHRQIDGQVDYWIRPSKRHQGYGKIILPLTLERFRQLGLQRILISCLAHNTASRRIIESNGGVYEGEEPEWNGDNRRRYWIEL